MSTIEQEIKTLAEKIWPGMHIEIGPNKSGAEFRDASPHNGGYTIFVRDNGVDVDKLEAGTLERLLEVIELKLNRG
jgi:hypothetical protein